MTIGKVLRTVFGWSLFETGLLLILKYYWDVKRLEKKGLA